MVADGWRRGSHGFFIVFDLLYYQLVIVLYSLDVIVLYGRVERAKMTLVMPNPLEIYDS
jgi:hypothetical protein